MGAKTRFVIFGQGRSGSTLLCLLLDSHPSICCEREILTPYENGYVRSQLLLRALHWFPYPLIYYRAFRAGGRVYGFKLFPHHVAGSGQTVRILSRLGWRVIHIQREDALEQSLSALVAERTRGWHRTDEESSSAPRLVLGLGEVARELEGRLRSRALEDEALRGVTHHSVVYEADLGDPRAWPRTVADICAFLGVLPTSVSSSLAKRYNEPYSAIVTNYEELVAGLAALPSLSGALSRTPHERSS